MKINNPRSIVDFTRGTSSDSIAYNLATVGQLKTAIDKLTRKFETYLNGTGNAGAGGTAEQHGYAWLRSDGKIDPSLMPALAITETHVIEEADLIQYDLAGTTKIEKILNDYIVANTGQGKNLVFQKGDIIIVHPGELDENGTIINQDRDTNSPSGGVLISNPKYSGSYIIADDINDGSWDSSLKFKIIKIAYTDSSIVKINGKAPANSAGEVTLLLQDILQTKSYAGYSIAGLRDDNSLINGAAMLDDVVYRLAANYSDNCRFGFLDKNSEFVPYAKLAELNDLRTQEETHFFNVSAALTGLNLRTFNTFESLSSTVDNTFGSLSSTVEHEITTINNTIGNPEMTGSREISAAIYSQLKELRSNVDDNLTLLNNTRCNTNDYLKVIYDNVQSIQSSLNETAVKIIEKTIIWDANTAQATVENFNAMNVTTAGFAESEIVNFGENVDNYDYARTAGDSTGIIHWVYRYRPAEVDIQSNSAERIIAVFDKSTGEQVFPDLKRVELTSLSNGGSPLVGTDICIDTEYCGETTSGYINSMVGTEWVLLIAKTIVGIPRIEDGAIFNVGGLPAESHAGHYDGVIDLH